MKETLIKAIAELETIKKSLEDLLGNDSHTAEIKRSITFEDVRAVLVEKSRSGFREQVKEIISKHGAEKLSDIKPSEFESVVKEAEVLGNE